MPGYSLGHVQNHILLRDLAALVTQDRATTSTLLAHISEVDSRRLYADEAFGSMFDYCVRVLKFTEDMAGMRIRAARVARRFPVVYDAIADGSLTVTALCLISRPLKNLSRSAARDLIAATENKTKDEIRLMLAERFPQPDLVTRVRPLADTTTKCVLSSHVLERVEVQDVSRELVASGMQDVVAAPLAAIAVAQTRPDMTTPLSPGRFGLQLTMSAETRDKLRRAQDLLGHAVENGDLASVLDRALDALIEKLQSRRFAATDQPRAARPSKNPDHIPAAAKRTVHARDGEQCTFVSESGRRCEERRDLEYDHEIPKARGGKSTVDNLRLRCFAHNQLEAERVFGAGFMQAKRGRIPDRVGHADLARLSAGPPAP